MKSTVQSLTAAALADKSRLAVFCELSKARLTFLVLLTTLVGFYVGVRGAMDYLLLLHTLLGTGLVAIGAAALNQFLERHHDARMRRTEDRPLPSGRLAPDTALLFGGISSAAGLIDLALAVNLETSVLGAITLCSYLFIYTPLKRVTTLNTAIGAVPGALPPLMGWTAARGEINVEGWSLFAILFFWQSPGCIGMTMRRWDSQCCRYTIRTAGARRGRRSAMRWVCCQSAFVRFCSTWRGWSIWPGHWCWAWPSYGRRSNFPAS